MLVINLQAQAGVKLKEKFKVSEKDLIDLIVKKGQLAEEKSYTVYMEECAEKGYTLAQGISIPLDLRSFVSNLEEDKILFQKIEGKKDVLIWNEEAEYFEWSFEVPQEGLYEISMEYYPLDGSGNPIQRSIMIDGEIPFIEAHNIQFYRIWNDKEEPRVNNVGDEVRPRQVEKREWQTVSLTDHQGMYSEPFRFYFTRGKHTMRLIFMEEPMAIGGITIKSPERIPAYEELLNEYEKKKL